MQKTTDDVLEYIPKAQRDKIAIEDFAWPDAPGGPKYPCDTQDHVDSCATLIGHAPGGMQTKIKARAIRIAKRHNFSIPDSWKDDAKKETTESVSASLPFSPRSKIATLTTCWLEDGAISLNGRQYPREAVDRLIQSAQLQLSNSSAAPLTCYISHDAADHDDSLKLAGKVTSVWREGSKAMASIDIANTSTGRDMAMQAVGGYLRTMSLRASNAEIKREKDSTWPTVGGHSLRLDGIDFTATPGIQVAQIQDVALAESAPGPQKIHEVFNAHAHQLIECGQKEGTMKIDEADQGGNTVGGYQPTSGVAPYMTGDPTQDTYGQRMYNKPDDTTGSPMQGMDKTGAPLELQEAHDRIAMVQGRSCAPGRESARWKIAFAGLDESERRLVEAGKPLSAKNDKHLDIAHDGLAKHMKMDCEGKNNKMGSAQPANDGMQDGDDDDKQSHRPSRELKEKHMTPEDAAKLLEAAGYSIQKPKSEAEQLREQLEAMKAEQARQLEEMRALIQGNQPNPQRKSLVEPSGNQSQPKSGKGTLYTHGKYLREQIKNADWSQLADRTAPLPDGIALEHLINEFTDLRVVNHFDLYGWPESMAQAERL